MRIIHTFSAIAADTTNGIAGRGSHSSAHFLAQITAEGGAGGDMVIDLMWSPDGTVANGVLIARTGTISAVGTAVFALQAPFTSTNVAIPEPNLVFLNEGTDGSTFTGTIIAFYGD